MKKRKIYMLVVVFIIIFGCAFGGLTFGLGNKILFTTKYYKKPVDAIEKDGIRETIDNDITIVEIDKNNALYFGLTSEKELLVAQMKISDGEYCFTGNYCVYSKDSKGDCLEDGMVSFVETSIYNEKGVSDGKLKYAISFEKVEDSVGVIREISSDIFKDFWLIYEGSD